MMTANTTTRQPDGSVVATREVTPSGVMATRRSVTSEEISANTVTPTSVMIKAIGPTHSCSNVNV